MMDLFHQVSQNCSRITTSAYSTSFASAIRLLHKDLRPHICNIYGFVRLADEVVDTFHDYDKQALLASFRAQTFEAIEQGISLNPILNSFQLTVNKYGIDRSLVEAFLHSMEMDLSHQVYDRSRYETYIYGSAEVVGLMCLRVFCHKDDILYNKLTPAARSLGAAFQKVNFLRDIKMDNENLQRMYFPGCDFSNFTVVEKRAIEADIQRDFDDAYVGVLQLPWHARFGVYVAYKYYLSLFKRIRKMQPHVILNSRVRVPDFGKLMIIANAGIRSQLNML